MKTYEIQSPQNETYKVFESLLTSSGIMANDQALLFGKKTVRETLEHHTKSCLGIILTPEMELPTFTQSSNLTIYRLDKALFKNLDVFGNRFPILLITPPQFLPWSPESASDGCQLLIAFQEPSNVGAVLRSAAAFGVSKIIISKGCAHPCHPKSSRAASGTLLNHEYYRADSLDKINFGTLPVVALDSTGLEISKFKFPKRFVLVPGVEGPGFPEGFKPQFMVSIAMKNQVESLNASVATAIALYAWSVEVSTF
ncbi:MAG: RNA methyltransferase [Oligoflexia bacterium]|nr:RNA methyltransferase [Oligoflexia bacterium]